LPGITYKDYEITLSQKESIFLYTDGVPEAKNGAGDFYGAQQMILDLADIEEGSPKWIIENLTEQIDTYVQDAEQFDDMTMLCLKYYGDDVTDSH
jgi:serine phosphatase RsbU (regulator of sigma subunit)